MKYETIFSKCRDGGIGRHEGLKQKNPQEFVFVSGVSACWETNSVEVG